MILFLVSTIYILIIAYCELFVKALMRKYAKYSYHIHKAISGISALNYEI